MRKIGLVLAATLASAALAACGSSGGGGGGDESPSSPMATMGNPASAYCESQGGTVDLATGICTLPDGTQIDEWELYNRDNG